MRRTWWTRAVWAVLTAFVALLWGLTLAAIVQAGDAAQRDVGPVPVVTP